MSKVLKDIQGQINRDGLTKDHAQVLRLYELLVSKGLTSSIMWREMTDCKFIRYGQASYQAHRVYSIKPSFLSLLEEWEK